MLPKENLDTEIAFEAIFGPKCHQPYLNWFSSAALITTAYSWLYRYQLSNFQLAMPTSLIPRPSVRYTTGNETTHTCTWQKKTSYISSLERQIQSSGSISIFGIFVNPIMRKAAPPMQRKNPNSRHHEAFLAKQNGRTHGKMSLLSAPGSVLIKTTLMKSLPEALWCTQTVFMY